MADGTKHVTKLCDKMFPLSQVHYLVTLFITKIKNPVLSKVNGPPESIHPFIYCFSLFLWSLASISIVTRPSETEPWSDLIFQHKKRREESSLKRLDIILDWNKQLAPVLKTPVRILLPIAQREKWIEIVSLRTARLYIAYDFVEFEEWGHAHLDVDYDNNIHRNSEIALVMKHASVNAITGMSPCLWCTPTIDIGIVNLRLADAIFPLLFLARVDRWLTHFADALDWKRPLILEDWKWPGRLI